MEESLEQKLKEGFEKLPKVVQDAITSADIEKRLRALSDAHKLHLDQWGKLENEVMLTFLGLERAEDLTQNIREHVGVSDEIARSLALAISTAVFDPVRGELERELEHPDAQAKTTTALENVAADVLATSTDSARSVAPGPIAPPATPPETKAVRAPISEAYRKGQASTVRKDVHNDPYREPPA